MTITDYFQLDDLHLLRWRLRPPNIAAQFQIARDFRVQFRISDAPKRTVLTVPNGMLTDLASIPQVAQAAISKLGPHIEAAVVHDYLCTREGDFEDADGTRLHVSSSVAADIFHAAMIAGRTDPEQAAIMCFAVKTFGPKWS